MSSSDNFIKGAFSISSIILAVLVIVSSMAFMIEAPTAQGVEINDNTIDHVLPIPAIMIDQPEDVLGDNIALAQLGDELVMVHFVEFPPMYINIKPPLNN